MKKSVGILLLISIMATPAYAAGDSGFYLGANIGTARSEKPASLTAAGATVTSSNQTVAGIQGGYQFNKNWGLELQFTGAGKISAISGANTLTAKADALSLSGVGILPMSNTFSIYGKLGLANTKTNVTAPAAMNLTSTNHSGATYGLGIQYVVSPGTGIRFGWDHYTSALKSTTTGAKTTTGSSVYSVGILFGF